MSASGEKKPKKKLVQFEAADKAHGDKKIPTSLAPDAVAMGGAQDGTERPQAVFQATGPRARGVVDEQFPTDALTQSDPRDEIMEAKLQSQEPDNQGMTPFGKLVASDADFEWLRKKRDTEAEANFQQWFASNFDHMSPTAKAYAKKMWPGFYKQRLALLEKDLDLLRRMAKLNITGIEDREDLLLQYAKEAGYIDMYRLENLAHPEKAAELRSRAASQARFKRGLLNPRRLPQGFNTVDRTTNARTALNTAVTGTWPRLGTTAPDGLGGRRTIGFNIQDVTDLASMQRGQTVNIAANLGF
jgi:hypothetical protein